MNHVSRRQVSERSNRKRIVACDAPAHPRVGWEILEERKRRGPNRREFFHVCRPRTCISFGGRCRHQLIEARQGTVEPAGEPECACNKQSLGVVDVIEQFADSPLVRRIALQGLFVRDTTQQRQRVAGLRAQRGTDITLRHEIDIAEVVVCGFGTGGKCAHTVKLTRIGARAASVRWDEGR
jgi:hypothetical protein